jgi:hypothetical protein
VKFISWILDVTLAAIMLVLVWVLGPEIETRWYPAYSKFTVLDVVPKPRKDDPTLMGSTITVEFTKYRDCFPQGYAWYSGDLGNTFRQIEVFSRRTPGSAILPIGRHKVTLDVNVAPEEFINGISAEIFNRCHIFWVTRSVVLP